MRMTCSSYSILLFLAVLALTFTTTPVTADFSLGPEEFVQAGGSNVRVYGYSVPSFVCWDGDGLEDLVVGEGGGGYLDGKVRVYLNIGTETEPMFDDYFYAQSEGSTLIVPGFG
jgi:hypothetical protein